MGPKRFLVTNKAMCFVVAVTVLFSTATALAEVRIVALGASSIRGYGVLHASQLIGSRRAQPDLKVAASDDVGRTVAVRS